MQTNFLTIPVRIMRGLLAVVFVVSNWFHSGSCCCASPSGGVTQDDGRCCAVEATRGCCCSQPTADDELADSTCCCSKTSQQSSPGCQGACHCSASPLTEGIIAAPQRIQQKQDQKTWLTDFMPLAGISTANACVELRPEQKCPVDPRAHNLRQSILCVWRN